MRLDATAFYIGIVLRENASWAHLYLIAARYYIEVVRDALVRGGGWPGVWDAPIALSIIGSVFFSIAWLRMRKMEVSA